MNNHNLNQLNQFIVYLPSVWVRSLAVCCCVVANLFCAIRRVADNVAVCNWHSFSWTMKEFIAILYRDAQCVDVWKMKKWHRVDRWRPVETQPPDPIQKHKTSLLSLLATRIGFEIKRAALKPTAQQQSWPQPKLPFFPRSSYFFTNGHPPTKRVRSPPI